MPSTTRLNHRHQPSDFSFSSGSTTSSNNSTRPALPQILHTSATNAVQFSRRSTAPTSRRVRSHWFTHFVLNWRRSSPSSKLILGSNIALLAIQVIAGLAVLSVSWTSYCDKPLRIFVSVSIIRLALTAPITIYLHLAPRRRRSTNTNTTLENRNELSEAYALSERNRPIPPPPTVNNTTTTTNNTNTSNNNNINNNTSSSSTSYTPVIPINTTNTTNTTTTTTTIINKNNNSNNNNHSIYININDSDDNLNSTNIFSAIEWFQRAKSALDIFGLLWFIVGNYMLFTSTTCSSTAVPLYYFSLSLIIYGYLILLVPVLLCTSVIFCLPFVLVGMRLLHLDDGVSMGGATFEEIQKIPVYVFSSSTTLAVNRTPTPKPPGRFDRLWLYLGLMEGPRTEAEPDYPVLIISEEENQICVICLSNYEQGDVLCKLWCKHHFHKACVHEWLALNYRCPMCKQDSRTKDIALLV
ncbi:hypothetical protein K501DRAFT_49410 [Backusella circina FSU 941]|nr:hypothetical protein K501DRAFT_49410 [Backusella circina FSU 941]